MSTSKNLLKSEHSINKIKLKCIDIERKVLDERNQSLSKLDQKIGIFTGFYFLFLIEAIKYTTNIIYYFKFVFIAVNIVGIVYLIKAFFMRTIDNAHINVGHILEHERINEKNDKIEDVFTEDVHKDYLEIEKDIEWLIEKRMDLFKKAIIFFSIGIGIILFIYFIK